MSKFRYMLENNILYENDISCVLDEIESDVRDIIATFEDGMKDGDFRDVLVELRQLADDLY